jgi:DNA-binding CsgD family transcriptional regulator
LLILGKVRARRGDPGAATALDAARELILVPGGEWLRIEQVAAARAEWRWLKGDIPGCLQEAEIASHPASESSGGWYSGEVAIWLWRGGGLSEAPIGIAAPYALEIAGEWQAAATEWERLGCPYEQALALADGDDTALLAALTILERLGAAPAAEIVRRRLRIAGVRGLPRGARPATRANPFGLTNRQLEILGLLAEGLHNAEIATRLSTTTKTVEHHVSAVLAKLDVRSRAEAIRLAYERELLSQTATPPTDKIER